MVKSLPEELIAQLIESGATIGEDGNYYRNGKILPMAKNVIDSMKRIESHTQPPLIKVERQPFSRNLSDHFAAMRKALEIPRLDPDPKKDNQHL